MPHNDLDRIWWILAVILIGVACVPCGLVVSDVIDPFLCPYPDLAISNLDYQSPANSGSEFTFTVTVTNTGTVASEETAIQAVLPFNVPVTIDETVPSLQPGESIEITITITIPSGVSIGNGFFSVILDPQLQNEECSQTNNQESGIILVLPPGMTQEEYEKLTNPGPFYKISQPPNPPAPPAPGPTPGT